MAFTHKIGVTFSNDAGTITSTTDVYTVDSEVNFEDSVPASTTNAEFDIAISVAKIKTLCIISDQNVTVKTNSTSTPGDTLALVASKQVVWTTDHLEANPLTADVTKLYITNSGSKVANVKFRCGMGVAV